MGVRKASVADGFAASALHGVLPLLVWAAHFLVSYVSARLACALDLQRLMLAGVSLIPILLWLLSAAAIGALLWMISLEGRVSRRHSNGDSMLGFVHIGASILALAGVLWSTVPIVLVPLCANQHQ